jgi:hypothetical protein
MIAGYWHTEGLDLYDLSSGRVKKIGSDMGQRAGRGSWFQAFWTKRLLVVGRGKSLHMRKKYPSTSVANIAAAVQMEVSDLFPIKNPAFVHRIFDVTETYTLVDIWAWEASTAESLKAGFPFTHVIPEELVFVADRPELLLWNEGEKQTFLAYGSRGFLGGATVMGEEPEVAKQRFLRSLGPYGEGIQEVQVKKTGEPPCLAALHKVPLKGFKVKAQKEFNIPVEMGLRVVAYGLLAYALFLFLSLHKYQEVGEELSQTLHGLNQQVKNQLHNGERPEDQESMQAIKDWLQRKMSPLEVMNLLAEHLPQKDYLLRLAINQGKVDMTVSGRDPLKAIKALSRVEPFQKIGLKGSPRREPGGERFRFVLQVEL